MANRETYARAWGFVALIYCWGVMTWCCGWVTATAAIVTPMAVIFVWGFIGAVIRHIQIKRAVERAIKR